MNLVPQIYYAMAPIFAVSFASTKLSFEEYLEGIKIPITFLLPIASTAIAALTAESIPPDNPRTILEKEFQLEPV